jgi:hypothetical protein
VVYCATELAYNACNENTMDELYSNDDRTWTNIRYVSRTKDRMLLQMFQNSELISRLFLNLKYYVDKKKKES